MGKAGLAALTILFIVFLGSTAYLFMENLRLKSEIEVLNNELSNLKANYDELSRKYDSLAAKYNELQTNHSSLKAMFETLSSKYFKLNEKYSKFVKGYSFLREEILDRAGDLSYTWSKKIDYTSPEVTQAVDEALGKWWWGINPYSKIYSWVRKNVKYNYDTGIPILPNNTWESVSWRRDYWKYASETAKDRWGDCEDQAILVAAMVLNYWLRSYNKTYSIWVVLILGHDMLGKPAGHAFTIIPVQGGKIIILDPAGESITGLDLWIYRIVEPKDIYEAITSYVKEWENSGTYWTKVYAVFNHKEYKILNVNIYEFIKWLYEQTK